MHFGQENNLNVSHNEVEGSEFSDDDYETALQLINDDPRLSGDPRVQAFIKNGFRAKDGRMVDPGHFLAAVLDEINKQPVPSETSEDNQQRISDVLDAGIVHSTNWMIPEDK